MNTIIKTDVVEMVHSGRNAPYGAKRIAGDRRSGTTWRWDHPDYDYYPTPAAD